MKRYIRNSRYNSKPSSVSKFEGFDKKKYYDLYVDLFRTITDGMNADLPNNIKEAFKKVGGNCRITSLRDDYVAFDGWVNRAAGTINNNSTYSCGGSIKLDYLENDARRLAEDLTMGYFKTTEGSDVGCNTYEFVDWILSSTKVNSKSVTASKVLKIKRKSGNIDTYIYKREDGQGSVYEPADSDDWFHSYIVTPEGKLLAWTTRGQYYPSNNEFWVEDEAIEGSTTKEML